MHGTPIRERNAMAAALEEAVLRSASQRHVQSMLTAAAVKEAADEEDEDGPGSGSPHARLPEGPPSLLGQSTPISTARRPIFSFTTIPIAAYNERQPLEQELSRTAGAGRSEAGIDEEAIENEPDPELTTATGTSGGVPGSARWEAEAGRVPADVALPALPERLQVGALRRGGGVRMYPPSTTEPLTWAGPTDAQGRGSEPESEPEPRI